MNLIAILEQEEIARLTGGKAMPAFAPGDTVVVSVNVVEGTRKRVQAFEGVVIAKRNRGLNSAFTVRKISSGEAVEHAFQLYSPQIAGIEVKRRGDVRRAVVLPAQPLGQVGSHQGKAGQQASLGGLIAYRHTALSVSDAHAFPRFRPIRIWLKGTCEGAFFFIYTEPYV